MPATKHFASSAELVAAAATMRFGICGDRTAADAVALGAPIPGAEVAIDGAFDGPFCVFRMRHPWTNNTAETVTVREIGIFDEAGNLLHRSSTGDGRLQENAVSPGRALDVPSFGICRTTSCDDTCRCPARLGGRPPCVPACKRLQPERLRSEIGACTPQRATG